MSLVLAAAAAVLGYILGSRCLAALYGLIDFSYAKRKTYPRVLGRIAFWGIATVATVAVLGGTTRVALLGGLAAAPALYYSLYLLRHLIVRKPPKG